MRIVTAVLMLLGAAAPALAQDEPDEKPLTGTYYVGPAADAEDPNTAPADHVYMTVTGDAAKGMWDAMRADVEPDQCVGRMAKWVDGLVCYGPPSQPGESLAPSDSPYECYLGINLKTAKLELGQDC